MNEHFYLDKNFQHKKLSEPVDMGNVLIKDLHQSVTTRMSCALQPGNITDAILYWFKLVFNDEVEIDTRSASRYDYGCFLIDRNYEQEFSEITVCLQKYEGIIKLYCENYPFCFIFIPAKIIIISSNK